MEYRVLFRAWHQASSQHMFIKQRNEYRVVNVKWSWVALGVFCNTRTNASLGLQWHHGDERQSLGSVLRGRCK